MTDRSSTGTWTRWQDWVEVVLGVVAALSPLWLVTTDQTTWVLVILGALIALDGLASLAMPGMVYAEWIQMVLGVLLFISPWVLDFTALDGVSWTAWIIGALTFLMGAMAVPAASGAQRTASQH